MIVCTHTCNDGYSFDHDVKQEYKCGNETYYYWDFQTDDNPYGRLPYCTGKIIILALLVSNDRHELWNNNALVFIYCFNLMYDIRGECFNCDKVLRNSCS